MRLDYKILIVLFDYFHCDIIPIPRLLFHLSIRLFLYFYYLDSLLLYYRGPRIALRGKVNETLITGLRIVDIILPIGRGQRELILGDRGTGKTSIVAAILIHNSRINYLSTIDGFGSRRIFGFYIGLNQNLSKIYQLTILSSADWRMNVILSTNSSSPAMMTFSLPMIAMI